MQSVSLEELREEGCGLSFDNNTSTWCCGDSDGNIRPLVGSASAQEYIEVQADSLVEAIAINKAGTQCVFAHDREVYVSDFPEVKNDSGSIIMRPKIGVSKMEFDISGKFIFIALLDGNVSIYDIEKGTTEVAVNTNKVGVTTFATMELEGEHSSLLIATVSESGQLWVHRMLVERGPSGKAYSNATQEFFSSSLLEPSVCAPQGGIGISFNSCSGPDHVQLALPTRDGFLTVLHRKPVTSASAAFSATAEQWVEDMPLDTGSGSDVGLRIARFSPNGRYVLTADTRGVVALASYAVEEKNRAAKCEVLRKWTVTSSDGLPAQLTDMQWGVASTSSKGAEQCNSMVLLSQRQAKVVEGVVNVSLGHALPAVAVATAPTTATSAAATSTAGAGAGAADVTKPKGRLSKKASASLDSDDEDDALMAVTQAEGEAADGAVDAVNVASTAMEKKKAARALNEDEAAEANDEDRMLDDDEDDLDGGDSNGGDDAYDLGAEGGAYGPVQKLQEPLQLGSTKPDEQGRRYLAWNHVGTVISREEKTGGNRVEVRFSSTQSGNKQEVISDHYGYTMAALSHDGAVFAAPPDESEEVLSVDEVEARNAAARAGKLAEYDDHARYARNQPGSVVYYHAFPSASMMTNAGAVGSASGTYNDSFKITLSHKEAVVAVACGLGWIALATSDGYLRLLSTTGIQIGISRCKGDIVGMVGEGSRLAVVYHRGVPLPDGAPNLALDILNIASNRIDGTSTGTNASGTGSAIVGMCSTIYQQDVPVPLSKGSSLAWIGFDVQDSNLPLRSPATANCSNSNIFTVLDSRGVLAALVHASWACSSTATVAQVNRDEANPEAASYAASARVIASDFTWTPVLELNAVKRSFEHSYWPIAVKGYRLVYVHLNGESKPAIYPHPVTSTCHFQMPIIADRTEGGGKRSGSTSKEAKEKDAYNETIRSLMLENVKLVNALHARDAAEHGIITSVARADDEALVLVEELDAKCQEFQLGADKAVLKVFQRACLTGKSHLAVDLVMRYLRAPKSLAAAITIADHHGRKNVAKIVAAYSSNLEALEVDAEERAAAASHEMQMGAVGANAFISNAQLSESSQAPAQEDSKPTPPLKSVLKASSAANVSTDSSNGSAGGRLVKKSTMVSPTSPTSTSSTNRVKFTDKNETALLYSPSSQPTTQGEEGMGHVSSEAKDCSVNLLADDDDDDEPADAGQRKRLRLKNGASSGAGGGLPKPKSNANPFAVKPASATGGSPSTTTTSSPQRLQSTSVNKYTAFANSSTSSSGSSNKRKTGSSSSVFEDMKSSLTASPSPVRKTVSRMRQ